MQNILPAAKQPDGSSQELAAVHLRSRYAGARKSAHPSQPARMLPWTQCRLTSSLRLVDASFLYQGAGGDGERRAEWIATSCATNQSLLRPFEAQRKVRSAVAHLHGSFHHSQRRQIFCRHDTQMLFTPVSNSAKGLQPALLTSSIKILVVQGNN